MRWTSGTVAGGALLAVAGTADPIDATVVLLAAPGDRILASDPADLTRLATAAANRPVIVPADPGKSRCGAGYR